MMGWVIKIDDIDAKLVKSRLPAVFEGDFLSPKKSNFIDDIAFLELKNDFEAVWTEPVKTDNDKKPPYVG